MNLRRDLYLIYKEAVNNIVKHSNAGIVKIEFFVKNREIILIVEDDGKGFEFGEEISGNGLANMRMRVERLQGAFVIETEAERGTKITVRIPY